MMQSQKFVIIAMKKSISYLTRNICNKIRPAYNNQVPKMVNDLPDDFVSDNSQLLPEDVQIEPPRKVILRTKPEFKEVFYPYDSNIEIGFDFGYTEPFRVLSDAGVQKLRAIVERESKFRLQNTPRTPLLLRGLGYLSNAVKQYSESSDIISLCSKISNQQLGVHPISMNMGHVNISSSGKRYVDSWHVDSVDYVLIVILSDMSDVVGGELQFLNIPDATEMVSENLKKKEIPEDLVVTIKKLQPGHGIFLHGSKILHRVKGVLEARDPRISMITSFCNLDVFQPDPTRFSTYLMYDREKIATLEFARHKAWRIEGKMKYIIEKCNFNSGTDHLTAVFAEAAEEINQTLNLIMRKEEDTVYYFNSDPVSKKN